MIPICSRKNFINLIAVWSGLLFTFTPVLTYNQTLTDFSSKPASYSIFSLVKTGDILPHTEDQDEISSDDLPPLKGFNSFKDRKFLRTSSGVFLATKDTLIPLVTDLDTIPGTEERFDDYWTHMGFGYGNAYWGKSLITGSQSVVFMCILSNRIDFISASPGGISKIFSLTKMFPVRGVTKGIPDLSGRIHDFFYGERENRPVVGILWSGSLYQGLFKENRIESAFIVFDGEKAETLVALGDSIIGRKTKLSYIGIRPGILYVGDEVSCDFSFSRCFFIGEEEDNRNEWQLYLYESGNIYSIARNGQELINMEGAKYWTTTLTLESIQETLGPYLPWTSDFTLTKVLLYGAYKMGKTLNHGFFSASKKGMERIAEWKEGDSLPHTNGGVIGRFGDNYMSPDSHLVIALISVDGSKIDIEEGIFSCEGNKINKLVAEQDSTPIDIGGTFSKFNQFAPINGDLLFLAEIEDGKANQGIFLLSDGQISKVVADGDLFAFKAKSGRLRYMPLLGITGFSPTTTGNIFFSGAWSGGEGWFLAVPNQR